MSGYWLIIFSIVVISMLLLITHSSWENYSDEIIWFSSAAKCTNEWSTAPEMRRAIFFTWKKNCNWWWLQSLVVMPGSRISFLHGGEEKKIGELWRSRSQKWIIKQELKLQSGSWTGFARLRTFGCFRLCFWESFKVLMHIFLRLFWRNSQI